MIGSASGHHDMGHRVNGANRELASGAGRPERDILVLGSPLAAGPVRFDNRSRFTWPTRRVEYPTLNGDPAIKPDCGPLEPP